MNEVQVGRFEYNKTTNVYDLFDYLGERLGIALSVEQAEKQITILNIRRNLYLIDEEKKHLKEWLEKLLKD